MKIPFYFSGKSQFFVMYATQVLISCWVKQHEFSLFFLSTENREEKIITNVIPFQEKHASRCFQKYFFVCHGSKCDPQRLKSFSLCAFLSCSIRNYYCSTFYKQCWSFSCYEFELNHSPLPCILKRDTIRQGGRNSQHVRRIKKRFYCKRDTIRQTLNSEARY